MANLPILIPQPQPTTPLEITRLIVRGLVLAVLLGIVGTFFLAMYSRNASQIVVFSNITSAALASLGTLLASTKSAPAPPPDQPNILQPGALPEVPVDKTTLPKEL